jgi:hypothetical protein
MKVRCTKLIDAFGNPQERSPWLTLGEVYDVLAVHYDIDRKWLFYIVGDGPNGLALFPLEQFEIVSAKLSSTWITSWKENGLFQLAPEPWTRPEFWEEYYNRKLDAVRVFEEEKRKIIDADP